MWENGYKPMLDQIDELEVRVAMFEQLITICSDRNEVIPKSVLLVNNRKSTTAELAEAVRLVEKYGWDKSGAKVTLR